MGDDRSLERHRLGASSKKRKREAIYAAGVVRILSLRTRGNCLQWESLALADGGVGITGSLFGLTCAMEDTERTRRSNRIHGRVLFCGHSDGR